MSEQFPEYTEDKITSAQIAYLLCICPTFNSGFMNALFKKYKNIVSTRLNLHLYIILNEPPILGSHFGLDRIDYIFLGGKKLGYILDRHARQILTDREIYAMGNDIATLEAAALFKTAPTRYVFVPTILDYSRNHNLVHQCAILYDKQKNILLFYEPYGRYMKFNKSYEAAVIGYLSTFKAVLPGVKIDLYHRHFNLADGIQGMILTANNNAADMFNTRFAMLSNKINTKFSQYIKIPYTAPSDDNTYAVLDLVHAVHSVSVNDIPVELHNEFTILTKDVLYLYMLYNSKTCVSITIVEFHELFKISDANIDTSTGLTSFYQRFDKKQPNIYLFESLFNTIGLFKYRSNVISIIKSIPTLGNVCASFK
jgi:hypothetical protein